MGLREDIERGAIKNHQTMEQYVAGRFKVDEERAARLARMPEFVLRQQAAYAAGAQLMAVVGVAQETSEKDRDKTGEHYQVSNFIPVGVLETGVPGQTHGYARIFTREKHLGFERQPNTGWSRVFRKMVRVKIWGPDEIGVQLYAGDEKKIKLVAVDVPRAHTGSMWHYDDVVNTRHIIPGAQICPQEVEFLNLAVLETRLEQLREIAGLLTER